MAYERYETEDEMRRGVSIRTQRGLFLAEPPDLREQTRERVRMKLRREKARGLAQPSELMRHAREIYDVDPKKL